MISANRDDDEGQVGTTTGSTEESKKEKKGEKRAATRINSRPQRIASSP